MPDWMERTAGKGALEVLEPASFQFALELQFVVGDFDGHDDRGVRTIEERGQEDAGLAELVVVALQAGEDEVYFFFFDGGG